AEGIRELAREFDPIPQVETDGLLLQLSSKRTLSHDDQAPVWMTTSNLRECLQQHIETLWVLQASHCRNNMVLRLFCSLTKAIRRYHRIWYDTAIDFDPCLKASERRVRLTNQRVGRRVSPPA